MKRITYRWEFSRPRHQWGKDEVLNTIVYEDRIIEEMWIWAWFRTDPDAVFYWTEDEES